MILKPPSLGGGDNNSSVIFCPKQYRVDGACTIPSTGAKSSSPFKVIGPHIQRVVLHTALVHIRLFNPFYAIQPAKYCTVNWFGASIWLMNSIDRNHLLSEGSWHQRRRQLAADAGGWHSQLVGEGCRAFFDVSQKSMFDGVKACCLRPQS